MLDPPSLVELRQAHFCDLAAHCARSFAFRLPLSENRGRREDRVRAAPAVSCAKCAKGNAHEHTGSAEASGLPCAVDYGLLRALPGERLSCHRRPQKLWL